MDGERYSDEIIAESLEDAEKRLRCIKGNANIIGELAVTIPLPFGDKLLDMWRKFRS